MNLANLDKILITDLLARGHLGVPDEERTHTQDILVNLVLFTDLRRCAETDHITDTVDYGEVSRQVLMLIERSTRRTAEALAGDIASLCLAIPKVEGVRVRLEKPNRVRFARAVGVEIERTRQSN